MFVAVPATAEQREQSEPAAGQFTAGKLPLPSQGSCCCGRCYCNADDIDTRQRKVHSRPQVLSCSGHFSTLCVHGVGMQLLRNSGARVAEGGVV